LIDSFNRAELRILCLRFGVPQHEKTEVELKVAIWQAVREARVKKMLEQPKRYINPNTAKERQARTTQADNMNPLPPPGALVYENVRFKGAQKELISRVGAFINVDGFGNCQFG
jgi:hypothetical protein